MKLFPMEMRDMSRFQAMLDELYNITELPSALFSLDGTTLISSAARSFVLTFSGVIPKPAQFVLSQSAASSTRLKKGTAMPFITAPLACRG